MRKKTMADFFREIHPGMQIKVLEHGIKPETVGLTRQVTEVRTKGIICDGSFHTDIPRSGLLEYDGETFTIYQAGRRDMTDRELEVHNSMPGSMYARRDYLKQHKMEYLDGEGIRGITKISVRESETGFRILDENIRGPLLVKYAIVGREYNPKRLREYYMEEKYRTKNRGRQNYVSRSLVKLLRAGEVAGIIYNGRKIGLGEIKGIATDKQFTNIALKDGKTIIKVPDDYRVGIKERTETTLEQVWFTDRDPQTAYDVDILEIKYKER